MSKLEEMLKYVSEHNEFYKNRIKEYGIKDPLDITQWPILTRKELQENRYNMFSDGYKAKYYNNELHRQSSSGSSGKPINIYWDYKDYYASILNIWRYRQHYYKIYPSDKYVKFTLSAFNIASSNEKIRYVKLNDNILNINMSLVNQESDYDKIIYLIEKFEPRWLYIQPFILGRLLEHCRQLGKKFPCSIVYIESVGELLPSYLKQIASQYFNVPVVEMYGSEEMNSIAYECPQNEVHVLSNNVYVECLNNENIFNQGEGEAIITSLTNKGMPLIRYNQEDEIVLKNLAQSCSCGGGLQTISVIKGRKNESLKIQNDFEINTFMLSEVIAEVNNHYNSVIAWYKYIYVKQEKKLVCIVELTKSKKIWFSSIKSTIISILLRKIPHNIDITFDIQETEQIYEYKCKHKFFEIIN